MSNVIMVTDSSPTKALIIRSEHNNNPPVSMWKQGDFTIGSIYINKSSSCYLSTLLHVKSFYVKAINLRVLSSSHPYREYHHLQTSGNTACRLHGNERGGYHQHADDL